MPSKRKSRQVKSSRVFVPRPPVNNGVWKMSHTLAFQGVSTITNQQSTAVAAFGFARTLAIATADHTYGVSGSFRPLFQAFRIRAIELYQTFDRDSVDVGAFPANTTGILWEGANTIFYSGDYKIVQALDEMQPGYLRSIPPRGSAAANWLYPTGGAPVCSIVNNKNTKVIVHMDVILALGGMPNEPTGLDTYSSLPSPVEAGRVYPLPLDGTDDARLIPIGVGVPL